jgi:hypothetical protein
MCLMEGWVRETVIRLNRSRRAACCPSKRQDICMFAYLYWCLHQVDRLAGKPATRGRTMWWRTSGSSRALATWRRSIVLTPAVQSVCSTRWLYLEAAEVVRQPWAVDCSAL